MYIIEILRNFWYQLRHNDPINERARRENELLRFKPTERSDIFIGQLIRVEIDISSLLLLITAIVDATPPLMLDQVADR